MKGFSLLEVIVAFTLAVLGTSLFYFSVSSLTLNLTRKEENEDISDLSKHVYVALYRDVNILNRGVTKEGELYCNKLELKGIETVRCPYTFKLEGQSISSDSYQAEIKGRWYLLPRIE
ncbi:MAG: hypothetical protein ACK4SM_05380 [Aquificaceae bacterium]